MDYTYFKFKKSRTTRWLFRIVWMDSGLTGSRDHFLAKKEDDARKVQVFARKVQIIEM